MEPGLGKSRVALEAARKAHRTIIIAPPNPAELVWPEQRELWAPDMSFRLVRGTPAERERILFDERPEIAVLNTTMVGWFYDVIARRRQLPYDLCVIDEATAVKNSDSIAFRALSRLQEHFDAIIPMTGTPAENSLHDIWAQLFLVDQGQALGAKIGVFRERYCRPVLRENYVRWEVHHPQLIWQHAAPLCFVRRANDCLDMPPLIFNDVYFDLTPKERAVFEKIDKKHIVDISTPFVVANTGVAYDKMRQVSSGFVYDEARNTHQIGYSKAEALRECLEEAYGNPVFIGFWFQGSKQTIFKTLGYELPTIDRYTSKKQKVELLARWNAGELPVLLGQIQSISMGPNMQSSNASVIFYDLPWSHGQHWQFIRRVWRFGQKTRVVVRRLIGKETKDSYVARILLKKQRNESDFLEQILRTEHEMG